MHEYSFMCNAAEHMHPYVSFDMSYELKDWSDDDITCYSYEG